MDAMFFISMVAGIVVLYLLHILRTTRINRKEEYEQQAINHSVDRMTGLKAIHMHILTIYEESGIRIPADILEELVHADLQNEEEVFKFIENQRQFWKLENTKKPFLRRR